MTIVETVFKNSVTSLATDKYGGVLCHKGYALVVAAGIVLATKLVGIGM